MLTDEINHVESEVERIFEMSFDHTAAMISLLNKKADELKADAIELHDVISFGRRQLRRNIDTLRTALDGLKFKKVDKLEAFRHKCREFGI